MAPMRKGPWTEQEDLQLVCFVGLFGDRRWDFIAQVSGLNRTGKSCRLRWVNYLHPGLKRGRMSPQEERLILELHSRWGNRWSRIARKLPGRTDNEIKNYWRTHMRKTAQERKKKILASSTSPSNSSSSSSSDNSTSACSSSSSSPSPQQPPPPSLTGSSTSPSSSSSSLPQLPDNSTTSASEAPTSESVTAGFREVDDEAFKGHFMDQIWDEIAMTDAIAELGFEECKVVEACYDVSCSAAMPSPMWENCSSYFLWKMDDEDLDHF